MRVRKAAIAYGLSVCLVGLWSGSASAGPNCGKRTAIYYERDKGFYVTVKRIGATKRDYTGKGSLLPGAVLYAVGPDKKPSYVHGPMLSSMFLDYEIDNVTWLNDLSQLPDFFRVMDNDGHNPLFRMEFLKCE